VKVDTHISKRIKTVPAEFHFFGPLSQERPHKRKLNQEQGQDQKRRRTDLSFFSGINFKKRSATDSDWEVSPKRRKIVFQQGRKRKRNEFEEIMVQPVLGPRIVLVHTPEDTEDKKFGEWEYWRSKLPNLEDVERTLNKGK
jgi:hypothetical protein